MLKQKKKRFMDNLTINDRSELISFTPDQYFQPGTMTELKRILNSLLNTQISFNSIKIAGSFHSCSKIIVSDLIIDVSCMPKTIDFPDENIAVVSANWILEDFLLELSKKNKSITAVPGTDNQTIGGMISTNASSASQKTGIYESIDWIEYITIDSTNRAIIEKRVNKNDQEFPAVVCSLGAIGILTKIQFSLVDELFFEAALRIIPIDKILGNLEKTSLEYDFWRVDWLPKSNEGFFWGARQIQKKDADAAGSYSNDNTENILLYIDSYIEWINSSRAGATLNTIMELIYKIISKKYKEQTLSGPLRNMLPIDKRMPIKAAMAEWIFDPKDVAKILELCKQYFSHNGWPNLPVGIEPSKTDSYFMSPNNQIGLDYVIKFNFRYLTDICYLPEDKQSIINHLKGLWHYLINSGIKFKADWGKINFMDYDFVRNNFELDRFKPHVQNMFLNEYLKRRLMGID